MEEHGKFNGQPNQMKEVFVEFRAYLAVGLLFVFRCRQANPYCAQDVIVQPVLFVTSKKNYYLCGNYNQQFSHEGVTPNV